MRDEFLMERGGKQYVLFAGLLDEWHTRYQDYSRSIETELVQVPTEENGRVAVVKATAKAWLQEDVTKPKHELLFDGIGDASPENVGRTIVPHIIRMAETRAKARALRDAVNVGVTALEELSEAQEEPKEARQDEPVSSEALERMATFAQEQLGWDEEKVRRAVAKWEHYTEAKAEDAYETMRSMVSKGA